MNGVRLQAVARQGEDRGSQGTYQRQRRCRIDQPEPMSGLTTETGHARGG